jgi:hypothetical protein
MSNIYLTVSPGRGNVVLHDDGPLPRGRLNRTYHHDQEDDPVGQKAVRFSDLSGQLITGDEAPARIVIREHPALAGGPPEGILLPSLCPNDPVNAQHPIIPGRRIVSDLAIINLGPEAIRCHGRYGSRRPFCHISHTCPVRQGIARHAARGGPGRQPRWATAAGGPGPGLDTAPDYSARIAAAFAASRPPRPIT